MNFPNARNRIVVDTDVVSYLFGNQPQAGSFEPLLSGKSLAVSFMTIAELYYGAYKKNWGERQLKKLENHLKNYVVLPYDFDVCLEWAKIKTYCDKNGCCIENSDCWIAATAIKYKCSLATNNKKHFINIEGLELIFA